MTLFIVTTWIYAKTRSKGAVLIKRLNNRAVVLIM